jgi:hypothetical protein
MGGSLHATCFLMIGACLRTCPARPVVRRSRSIEPEWAGLKLGYSASASLLLTLLPIACPALLGIVGAAMSASTPRWTPLFSGFPVPSRPLFALDLAR